MLSSSSKTTIGEVKNVRLKAAFSTTDQWQCGNNVVIKWKQGVNSMGKGSSYPLIVVVLFLFHFTWCDQCVYRAILYLFDHHSACSYTFTSQYSIHDCL